MCLYLVFLLGHPGPEKRNWTRHGRWRNGVVIWNE